MRKLLSVLFVGTFVVSGANANMLENDTSDPLYMPRAEEILSESTVSFGHDILRFGEKLSYGMNNRFTISASVHYQNEFGGNNDGFSSTDLGVVYRAGASESFISDVIAGFKFGGSRNVRTPDFADSTYYAGWRFGRQWAGVTLAGTVQSNWIFDDVRGMSYIDFIPEAYFRFDADMRLGLSATVRKATNPHYNEEWIGGKFVRQFGRTQYVGHIDYEFEGEDVQVGARVNILF